jgi:hypothetical protein
MKPLGKTSVSNIIQGLDMQGLINAGTLYQGRHGRKRLMKLNMPKNKIEELPRVSQK